MSVLPGQSQRDALVGVVEIENDLLEDVAADDYVDGAAEAILQYVKRKYNLFVGENTAELVKIRLASAWHMDESKAMEVKGRDLGSGLPKTLTIRSEEIREALQEPLSG